MPTNVQNTDRDTTWDINVSDQTWTLTKNATITTDNQDGISVASDITGSTINLFGDMLVTGTASAMKIEGDYTEVNVGKDSVIDASDVIIAIDTDAMGTVIGNAGKIMASGGAVDAYIGTEVVNTGIMKGGYAVYSNFDELSVDNSGRMIGSTYAIRADSDDAMILNREGGLMKGGAFGIVVDDGDGGTIKNFGTLKGDIAISAFGDGVTNVINHGAINGDIDLAGGNDRFDTRGGTVNGNVDGGDGADLYLISDNSIKITEAADHGADTVNSTVSFRLGANLENLKLAGKADIDATGNGLSNNLYGNNGDNVIKGLGGEDYIMSGQGDDLMLGGKGDDFFYFKTGTDHDVIGDFNDGHELIFADFVTNEADFNDLVDSHLKVKGDDLLIHYGDDTLLIKDMAKSDLGFEDFFTGL